MENQPRQVVGAIEFRGFDIDNRLGHEREIRVGNMLAGIEGVSQVSVTRKDGKADQSGVDLAVKFNKKSTYSELRSVGVQVKGSKEAVRLHKRSMEKRNGLARGEWSLWAKKNKRILLVEKSEERVVEEFHKQAQGMLDYKREIEDFSYLLEGYPEF